MKKIIFFTLLSIISLPLFSQTKVGNATLPQKLSVENQELVLNGAGLREKYWFDLYACGLYLENKSSNAQQIVTDDKPMVIYIEILSSLLSKKKLVGAFKDGIKKTNSEETVAKINTDLNTFLSFIGEIVVGDKYYISYTPNQGTALYINNSKKGTIKGHLFKSAIYNIWLAQTPVDKGLKNNLLNK